MASAPNPRRPPSGAALLRRQVTEAIRAAALDELAESGYARMSMEAVARRAGVGKAALYRRWASKRTMVEQIVADLAWDAVPVPDTGSLRGDIERFVSDAAALRDDRRATRIIADLSAEAARDPRLARSFLAAVRGPRREAGVAMLRRAIARGELPEELDVELALDCMVALANVQPYSVDAAEHPAAHPTERLVEVIVAALARCRR